MIPWEPMFDSAALQGIHCVWVEFVGLPCWLWGSLRELASRLGTPIFVPDKRGMGRLSNRVCIWWNVARTPPKSMVVNVGVDFKVIPLHFKTFFGAYFKCNKFGHFAKQCPTTLANKEREHEIEATENRPSMEPKETSKRTAKPTTNTVEINEEQRVQRKEGTKEN